ncbi:hypothetical protein LIER_41382 [Lithospermum erythrorhizon]|uniref:Uncharacterized protein n=1 Tax=Lithospermum erythrorhizon TaxID=34254 RepID=A0AAV3R9Z1_LITER
MGYWIRSQALLAANLMEEIRCALREGHEFIQKTLRASTVIFLKGHRHFPYEDLGWQVSECTAEGLKCCLLLSMMPPEIVGEKLGTERLFDNCILHV